MEPRRYAAFYECLGVLMGILLLHGGEPRYAQIREVLTILPAALGMVTCHSVRATGSLAQDPMSRGGSQWR